MNNERSVQYYIDLLLDKFGADLKKYEPDLDLPYILFSSFSLYLTDLIKDQNKNIIKIKMATEFIEQMAFDNNNEVQDLFMVGFLEVFVDEESNLIFAKDHFSKLINEKIKLIEQFWGK